MQPYPCSKPLRSDKVPAGGREKVGPGTQAHIPKKGDKAVARVGEKHDLSPRRSGERSENSGGGSSLQVAFGAGSLTPAPTPEDTRDVFRGGVEVCRTRTPQASGSQVQTLTSSGEGDVLLAFAAAASFLASRSRMAWASGAFDSFISSATLRRFLSSTSVAALSRVVEQV